MWTLVSVFFVFSVLFRKRRCISRLLTVGSRLGLQYQYNVIGLAMLVQSEACSFYYLLLHFLFAYNAILDNSLPGCVCLTLSSSCTSFAHNLFYFLYLDWGSIIQQQCEYTISCSCRRRCVSTQPIQIV